MKKEDVRCSITGCNSTNPSAAWLQVQKWTIKDGKSLLRRFRRRLAVPCPDNVAAGRKLWLTDSLGRVHGDAQFAGSLLRLHLREMMGLIGVGNNPWSAL